jgi:ABC-type glycerol-3-phosphate transport system permease component
MIVTSLRKPAEVFEKAAVPSPPSFQNYTAVFDPVNNFARALLNSIIVAGVTTVAVLIIGVFAAYALARLDFRGKNLALSAIIATSMFPGIALVVPLLKIFTDIGWINTYQALILPSMSFALPLVKPALLVAVLFRMLQTLAMFDLPYVLVGKGKPSVETLSILAQQESVNTRYGPAAAYAVLLFLYLVLLAYAFIKLLGADVIGDQAPKRAKVKGQKRSKVGRSVAKGDMP